MDLTSKTIPRTDCVLTGNSDLEYLYTFKKFPVFTGCIDCKDPNEDIFCDMEWGYSKSSGSLQLTNLIDPKLLYSKGHGSGTIGQIWKRHHEKFFNFISKFPITRILEIGGASGNLVKHFLSTDKQFDWTIIEPSDAAPLSDSRIRLVRDFFENFDDSLKFDTVIHSHVFEHAYNPKAFLQKISSLLTDNGLQFISIPNMKHWLQSGFTNTLSFEHTFYVDDKILVCLLQNTGFEVLDISIDEHSIFIACRKNQVIHSINGKFDYVRESFQKFICNIQLDIDNILKHIGTEKVYLFGGHIFSQTLLNLGLPENQVIGILDNDVNKHGKRLYGYNLFVQSPKCLQGIDNPIVILRAGVYTNEIKQSILTMNQTARIV